MLHVRQVNDAADFDRSTDSYVLDLWETGASRPEWCFVLENGNRRLGRLGLHVSPTTTDPRWLGNLPPEELFIFGLDLPWDDDPATGARLLLAEAARSLRGRVPPLIEIRSLNEAEPRAEEWHLLSQEVGFNLFAEKQGFEWVDDGTAVSGSDRLHFRAVSEIGIDAFREVMAPCGQSTLDRNDRYYWQGCGPDNWAAQMAEYFDEADADMWLVGYRDATPVGYVAVARDDDLESTIAHIGVLPSERGNGYIGDLLAAGTAAAQRAGIGRMLDEVDVVNRPMVEAMIRAGHMPDRRPWHLWVHRAQLASFDSE